MIRNAQVRFSIAYSTHWGESVIVRIFARSGSRSVELTTCDGENWSGMTEVFPIEQDEAQTSGLGYSYQVLRDGEVVRREPDGLRRVVVEPGGKLLMADCWAERILTREWMSSAFTQCVFKTSGIDVPARQCALTFNALPPAGGMAWAVCGSCDSLGQWTKPLIAHRVGIYRWTVELPAEDFCHGFEYKYVVTDPANGRVEQWEDGGNRVMAPQAIQRDELALRQDDLPRIEHVQWKGAGVVVPVFSLRSGGSAGIGDFGDLGRLVDWAAGVGMRVVQTLPINDTNRDGSWRDSYPYNGISAFALHPVYVDPREWKQTQSYGRHRGRFARLNVLADVDYEAVMSEKQAFLRDLYGEIGQEVMAEDDYAEFKAANAYWLDGYVNFCTLRDKNLTADFRQWEHEANVAKNGADEFHAFVQYLLHRQMKAVHERARRKGVVLKGDIPIGICRDSADAWTEGLLFNFDEQAGAPPDAFDPNGQNWGFPTYNWEEMERDGFLWWKRRLARMGEYFDAYRIDHVLGFFRIWEIPSCQKSGILGHFRPAIPLTEDEIRGFGIRTDAKLLCNPTITDTRYYWLIEKYGTDVCRFFGEERAIGGKAVRQLKEEWQSQRKLLAEASLPEELREELSTIVAEVLFVADPYLPGTFHPRFGAYSSHVFSLLSNDEQAAFCNLHENFFFHRHDAFWAKGAMRKLSITDYRGEGGAGCMLPCAEDLGMVPGSVTGVLAQLRILSLEIQRMPKQMGQKFADTSAYPYLSVAATGTHDMPPLRLWWDMIGNDREDFWSNVLGNEGEAPRRAEGEVSRQIVRQHLLSPSMLCVLPIQDWIATDAALCRRRAEEEWINDPSNPDQYWRYRMDVSLEELLANDEFNAMVKSGIKTAGR